MNEAVCLHWTYSYFPSLTLSLHCTCVFFQLLIVYPAERLLCVKTRPFFTAPGVKAVPWNNKSAKIGWVDLHHPCPHLKGIFSGIDSMFVVLFSTFSTFRDIALCLLLLLFLMTCQLSSELMFSYTMFHFSLPASRFYSYVWFSVV